MEQFKIDHYECEHGPGAFPQFRELSAEECLVLRRELCTLLALDSATKSLTLLRMLDQLAEPLNEISAEDEAFELAQIFHESKLDTGGRVFLNWNRFDRMDEMSTSDLSRYFSYIWYPSSDDLEIVDTGLKWVIRISHHGAVSLVRLR